MFFFDLLAEKNVQIPRNKALQDGGFKRFIVSPDFQTMAFQGQQGNIHLLSGKSKEWIGTMKMNGSVSDLAFSGDSKQLLSVGDAGKVYIWDLRSRSCSSTFMDDGCVGGTSIAVSPNDAYVAVGSNTGVVNLYNKKQTEVHCTPRPLRAVLNLTTSVTCLKFNTTSEILAMSSNYLHGAVKLLHTDERQVIASFPELNQKIRKPESIDFSLNSGYMTIGNNNGEALLYRIDHYTGY